MVSDAWNDVKKRIQKEERKIYIRSGEVRWISIGMNVGSEIDGKGVSYTRPALVLHVIGSHLALIVPMSTKIKQRTGYFNFTWNDREVSLCIHQIKIISQKRILRRIGKISENKLNTIKKEVTAFFHL